MREGGMRGFLVFFALTIVTFAVSPAVAQTAVFGIALGGNADYPPCGDSLSVPAGAPFCGWALDPAEPYGESGHQVIPAKPMPTWADVYPIYVYTRAGTVAAIEVKTAGAETQSTAFAELKAKFGKPTTLTSQSKQNAFGVKVDAIEASWGRDDGVVRFSGVDGRFDEGSIWVMSASEIKALSKLKPAEQKL
jgi:hypothetical protein